MQSKLFYPPKAREDSIWIITYRMGVRSDIPPRAQLEGRPVAADDPPAATNVGGVDVQVDSHEKRKDQSNNIVGQVCERGRHPNGAP